MSQQKKILIFLWTFLLLLFRPSVFGEKFNLVIFFLFSIISLLLFAVDSKQESSYKVNSNKLFAISLILLIVFYLLIQGLIISDAKKTVINSCLFIAGISICVFFILNKKNTTQILTSFINIHYALSISILVTYFLILFWKTGLINVPSIANLSFLTPGYKRSEVLFASHELLFPFTIVWSTTDFLGLWLPRCVGLYREPGMAQVFFTTAYFLTFLFPVHVVRRKRNVILIASLFLFSSAWLLSLSVGYILFFITHKLDKKYLTFKHLSLLLIIPVFLITVLYTPSIGLRSKIESLSGQERLRSLPNFVGYLKVSPIFGDGYYNGFDNNKEKKITADKDFPGILMFIYQGGLIVLILYLMLWYLGLFKLGNVNTLFIYIPCLVTLITSQPMYNDAIIWFLILLDTSNKEIYY